NVREVFGEQKGDYIPGAEIELYRLSKHKKDPELGIPKYEGDLLQPSDWQVSGDKVLIAARTTPDPEYKSNNPEDYTVSFPRLFKKADTEKYDTLIHLKNGKDYLVYFEGDLLPYNLAPVIPIGYLNFPSKDFNASFPQRGSQSETPQIKTGPNNDTQKGKQPTLQSHVKDKWKNWSYNQSSDKVTTTLLKKLTTPPHSKVTGTLNYKYKNDPSIPPRPYANMPVKLMVVYLHKKHYENGTEENNILGGSTNEGYYN